MFISNSRILHQIIVNIKDTIIHIAIIPEQKIATIFICFDFLFLFFQVYLLYKEPL